MANPEALKTAHSSNPKSLKSPVPESQDAASAMEGAPTAKMGEPPAQGEPAPSPQGGGDDLEAMLLATPTTPALQQKAKMDQGRQDPMDPQQDPNMPSGFEAITARIRKAPDGQLQHLDEVHGWMPFDKGRTLRAQQVIDGMEWLGVRAKEDLPRFVGAMAGASIGSNIGKLGGPVGMVAGGIAGSALGQAAGGAFQNVMENRPVGSTALTDMATGAVGSAIPLAIGSPLLSAARSKAVAYGVASAYGGESAVESAASRLKLSKESGIPITKAEMMPGTPEYERAWANFVLKNPYLAKNMNAERVARINDFITKKSSDMQAPMLEQAAGRGDEISFQKILGDYAQNLKIDQSRDLKLVNEIAGEQSFPIDPIVKSLTEKIQTRLGPNDQSGFITGSGNVDPAKWNKFVENSKKAGIEIDPAVRKLTEETIQLQNVAKGKITEAGFVAKEQPGLTFKEMEMLREKYASFANFDKAMDRDFVENAYSSAYVKTAQHQSEMMTDVLNKAGHPDLADRVKARKEALSIHYEDAMQFQKMAQYDPTNIAAALIKRNRPTDVLVLKGMLEPQQFDYLGGSLLNSIAGEGRIVDPITGRPSSSAATAWRNLDPKIKDAFYGKDGVKQIDAIINIAKVVDLKGPSSPVPSGVMGKLLGLVHGSKIKGAHYFMDALFGDNPSVAKNLMASDADLVTPHGMTPEAIASKKMQYEVAAKALLGPVKAATQAYGADVASSHRDIAEDAEIHRILAGQ